MLETKACGRYTPKQARGKIFVIAHNHLFLGGGGAEGALGLTFCGVDLHFSS